MVCFIPWSCDFVPKKSKAIVMTRKYLMGGKLGDFVHMLYAIHAKWIATGEKAIIYISDQHSCGGHFGSGTPQDTKNTFDALRPIMEKQPYVQSFHYVDDESISYDVNLNTWRYIYAFSTDWIRMLHHHYQLPPIPKTHMTWIQPTTYSNHDFSHLHTKVLVHRSYITPHRCNPLFPWTNILRQNDCIFISTDPNEYEHFEHKSEVPFMHVNNLAEFFTAIYSCKFFIGNQSAPVAIAWAMGKPLLAEINTIDAPFYKSPDIMWYLSPNDHSITNLSQWIKY
jgi:hypothetical protein